MQRDRGFGGQKVSLASRACTYRLQGYPLPTFPPSFPALSPTFLSPILHISSVPGKMSGGKGEQGRGGLCGRIELGRSGWGNQDASGNSTWLLLACSTSEQPCCSIQNLLVWKLLETGKQKVKCVLSMAQWG